MYKQSGLRLLFTVECHHAGDADVENGVAKHQQEVLLQPVSDLRQRTGGTQRLLLPEVVDADAEVGAAAEICLDLLAQIADDEKDVRDTAAAQTFDLPLQNGLAGDGRHGLGDLVIGDGAQAGTLAACHDDRLH